jgi:4-carboxymuconolactone decarboxylase
MSRIPPADLETQQDTIRDFVTRRGKLNAFRMLANAPHAFVGWTRMVDELFASPTFSPRMREIVILRVAHLQGCRYELSHHAKIASSAGLTESQINAILGDIEAADFTSTERLLLDLVTELCTTHRLTDDSFAVGHDALGDNAFTELLMFVSCYYGLALVLNATDVDVDPYTFQP